MKRFFINQGGDSNKFWTIEQAGHAYTVHWGKIGAAARSNTKEFASVLECATEMQKLIGEKLKRGYSEVAALEAVVDKPQKLYAPMSEAVFWEIISLFNWKKTGDDAAVLRPAVNYLAQLEIEDIYKFADILSEKLYLLDGIAYASNIGEESYINENEPFSVDYFLYVRCCVVANGKDFFSDVLKNPEEMPEEMDFEALLYLPEEAYTKKTKMEDYGYQPKFDFETFSNKDGWNPGAKAKKPIWKFW